MITQITSAGHDVDTRANVGWRDEGKDGGNNGRK